MLTGNFFPMFCRSLLPPSLWSLQSWTALAIEAVDLNLYQQCYESEILGCHNGVAEN
jgi:hypothetical protein